MSDMSVAPSEGQGVSEFVWTRWRTAMTAPSRDNLGLLMLATKVAHRRARRALERVFDDTEDPHFKRELLLTYASLDQQMDLLREHDDLAEPDAVLRSSASLLQTIDGVFGLGAGSDVDETYPGGGSDETLRDAAPFEDRPTEVFFRRAC